MCSGKTRRTKSLQNDQKSTKFLEQDGKLGGRWDQQSSAGLRTPGLPGQARSHRHCQGGPGDGLGGRGTRGTKPALPGQGLSLAVFCMADESWKWQVRRLSASAPISLFPPSLPRFLLSFNSLTRFPTFFLLLLSYSIMLEHLRVSVMKQDFCCQQSFF